MKKVSGKLALGSLILALAVSPVSNREASQEHNLDEKGAKVVNAGRLEYNDGPLISHGFLTCSGVIFDYGNEAIMAHALPGTSWTAYDGLGSDKVISKMIEESNSRGLDYRKAKIILNVQNKVSLDTIVNDLKQIGLKPNIVQKDRMNNSKLDSVSIYYDPASDSLHTRETKDSDFKGNEILEVY